MYSVGAKQSGFTLIEMLVTVSVLVILATVAVPSFTSIIRTNRAVSEANQVLSIITLARSEAIRRNRNVTVCASLDGERCSGSTTWALGAIVFVDVAPFGQRSTSDSREALLQSAVPLSQVSTITTSGLAGGVITYSPLGRPLSNAMGNIQVEPVAGQTQYSRRVVISAGGRPQIQAGT